MSDTNQNTNSVNPGRASQEEKLFNKEDLDILKRNRDIKQKLLNIVTKDGTTVPEDRADKALLTSLLDSLDKEVLNRAKLKVMAKSEETASDTKALIADMLLNYKPNKVLRDPHENLEELLEPPSDIVYREPVPGEKDIGSITLSLNDIEEK